MTVGVSALTRTARAARPPTCVRSSASVTVNWPWTSIGLDCPRRPRRCARRAGRGPRTSRGSGSPRCAAPRRARGPRTRRTARRTGRRPREARCGNRFRRPARPRRRPGPGRPRTGRARRRPARRATPTSQHLGEQLLAREVDLRRHAAEVAGGDLRPDRAVELVAGVAEQDQRLAGLGAEAGRDAPVHVVDDAEHADHRGRQDRGRPGLVVEADVAAGDRDAQLPHSHRRGRGRPAENCHITPGSSGEPKFRQLVTAIGRRAGDRDVAVGLGQRQLRAGVRVERGVAAGRVGGHARCRGRSPRRCGARPPSACSASTVLPRT